MSSEAGPSTGTPINPTSSVKRARSADYDDGRPSKRLKDADEDASGHDDDEQPELAAPTSVDVGPAPDNDDDEDVVEATLMARSEPPVVPETHSPSLTQPVEQDPTTSLDRSTSPRDGVSSVPKAPLVTVEDSDELEIKSLPNSPAPEKKPVVSLGTELAEYACPICFTPPTNATLTPCGHICCGSCLFSAIKIAATRNLGQEFSAKCPVCRANIPGWDGRGGGVIGLKPRVVYSF